MNNIAVSVKNMTMAYHDKPVLTNVNVEILKGRRTGIIGPNGAGKSTFLKGVLGLQKCIKADINIDDLEIREARKRIAYIPQKTEVNWEFPTTVLDVVLMGRYVHLGWFRRPGKKDRDIAHEAIKMMGLSDYEKRPISMLSGGQKQRVFIARALAQKADIYFMDEPLAGVDIDTEKLIMDFVKESSEKGKTFILVHHDLNTVKNYFDDVIILNKEVHSAGAVEDVFNRENLRKAGILWV